MSTPHPPALPAVPGIPCDAEGPVFGAPWHAQAFAMAVALHERGLFAWPDWAQVFGACIRQAPALPGEDPADAYYRQWLDALERIVERSGASSGDELRRWQAAWDRAADRTPHGRPIELQPGDFGA